MQLDKRNITIIGACAVVIVLILVAAFVLNDRDGGTDDDRTMKAAELLENGRFQEFYDDSDPVLQTAVGGAEGLEAMWDGYTYGIGDFVQVERTESFESGTNTITYAYCQHTEWGLLLTITFGYDGKYVGLFFGYYEPEDADPLPEGLTETDVTVDAGTGYPLPGTLTSSDSSDHEVAAVIVHGSGPNDRDGTVGANKPYRDIARGLAEKGIDVLTYDKRTDVYTQISQDPARYTVEDEVVDDAVAAVRMLNGMGYGKVFIIGHSLGGMLAPYIAQQCGDMCDGLVSLAGSPRTITDILADQLWAQYSQLPDAEAYRAYIDGELEKADSLAAMTDDERASTTVFGQSGYYIWSLDSIDEVPIAESLDIPMLFLQGSADFQVYADVDFAAWEDALSDDPDAEFVLYDGLNHLFIESEGPYAGTTSEYNGHGSVDSGVVDDIAGFILNRS